jgi:hypothetical protein
MLSKDWYRSTRSAQGNCVEARRRGQHTVEVRDSKDSGGPMVTVSAAAWQQFVAWLG